MASDFSRMLTHLRKERKLSQKYVASELNISQALLSHYEKGIRECGLDFLKRASIFYGVTTDYLLCLSPDKQGTVLLAEDIPTDGNKQSGSGGAVAVLSKKLISNSVSIVIDIAAKTKSTAVVSAITNYLFLSVYHIFRLLYSANSKNSQELFSVDKDTSNLKAKAAKLMTESSMISALKEVNSKKADPEVANSLSLTSKSISDDFPELSPSLFNLIKNAEHIIEKE